MLTCFLLALLAQTATPAPEELAAMLVSPRAEHRDAAGKILARDLGDDYERKLLIEITRWAHTPEAWIEDLERRAKGASGAELKRVHRMLDVLKGAVDAHLSLDLHFIAVPKDVAVRVLGVGMPTVVHTNTKTWNAWWADVRRTKGTEAFFKRTLTCRDTRPAKIEVLRKTSYVAEYRFDKETSVIHPVIKQATSGTTMAWTPFVTDDGRFATLHFDIKVENLVKPIKTAHVTVGGQKVKIQVPETVAVSSRTVVTVPLAGYGAWRFPADAGDLELLVLVRAQPVKVKR